MSENNQTTPDAIIAAAAAAAYPQPIVHGAPVAIAEGVFVIPDGRVPLVPNIGIIVGERAALVVDSGLGPRSGEIAYKIARELAGDRQLFLTLTHFHPEHGFGAQAFSDATILYNRAQHEEFRQKGPGYLGMFSGMGDAIAEQLARVNFVDPHIVYEMNADIDLGGKVVQLRSWGRGHTRGDQVIFLPAERILFTGDLAENGFYPIFPFFPPYDVDVDGAHWIEIIEELLRMAPSTIVPGHGKVGGAELLTATHDYLTLLSSETKRLTAAGNSPDEIVGALVQLFSTRFPDWDIAEPWRIATGVQAVLAQ